MNIVINTYAVYAIAKCRPFVRVFLSHEPVRVMSKWLNPLTLMP